MDLNPASAGSGLHVSGGGLRKSRTGRVDKQGHSGRGDQFVQQFTKVELIINLKTARALGLTVPLPLIGRADEVIE